MAVKFADRVRVTTPTIGRGLLTLGPAVSGFRSFGNASALGTLTTGCTVHYVIEESAGATVNWEVGSGIYTVTSPNDTLSRVVAANSTGDTIPISLSGAAQVYLTATAATLTTVDTQPQDTNDRTYATTGYVIGQAATVTPNAIGQAGNPVGTSLHFARADHIHSNSMTNGINFGSAVGASPSDLTKHIQLYNPGYGLSITGSRLNIVSSAGTAITLVNGTTDVGSFTATGLNGCVIGQTTRAAGNFSTVVAQTVATGPTTTGTATLISGDTANTGYIGFWNAAGVRQGYIGYASGGVLNLAAANISGTDGLGQVNVSGQVSVSGSLGCANMYSVGAVTGAAFTVNAGLTVAGGNTAMAGALFVVGATYFSSSITGGGYAASADSGGRYLQFSPSWYLAWTTGVGDLRWETAYGQHFVIRASDGLVYNNRNGMAGYGPYTNLSDERVKQNIEDYTSGLDTVVNLRPISFQRLDLTPDSNSPRPRREVGFSAQELREHLPHAVHIHDTKLPDGTELDDDEPLLAVSSDTIIAALVNAVKELSDRVIALEAR